VYSGANYTCPADDTYIISVVPLSIPNNSAAKYYLGYFTAKTLKVRSVFAFATINAQKSIIYASIGFSCTNAYITSNDHTKFTSLNYITGNSTS
jgi:hypothetical protein